MNLPSAASDKPARTEEETMTELTDIFAYAMTTTVFFAGSLAMLTAFAAVALWTTREAAPSAAFAPACGL